VKVRFRPDEKELFAGHHADSVGHELLAVPCTQVTLVRVAGLELHRAVVAVVRRLPGVTTQVLLETSKQLQTINSSE